MNIKRKSLSLLALLLMLSVLFSACGPSAQETPPQVREEAIIEGEQYSTPEEVAAYLITYGVLPDNYLIKEEARDLGWVAEKGNLWEVAPGMSIGGDKFGNREGKLPREKGLQYYECDVNYKGGYRGPERLVYNIQGPIYYTPDHYNHFELLRSP